MMTTLSWVSSASTSCAALWRPLTTAKDSFSNVSGKRNAAEAACIDEIPGTTSQSVMRQTGK